MSKLLISNTVHNFYRNKYHFPKTGSYIACTHFWFEYKTYKAQYFVGRCLQVRSKGILSSIKLRTFCYKTVMECLLFINSPTIHFLYSFIRDNVYKKMSFVFVRKTKIKERHHRY